MSQYIPLHMRSLFVATNSQPMSVDPLHADEPKEGDGAENDADQSTTQAKGFHNMNLPICM